MNDLNTYKIIVLAADNNNFSTTAAMLNMVPSNVSRIIKKQEDKLGFSIFNRSNNRLELTEKGKIYVEHAQEILQKENEFYSNSELFFPKDKVIRIGLGPYFIARLYKLHYEEFHKIQPDIRFNLITKNNMEILNMLEHNLIDIAIIKEIENSYVSQNFKTISKFYLSAHFYTTNIDYKDKREVEATDEIFEKLVVPYSESTLRSFIDNYFAMNNLQINPVAITNNIPVIFDLIFNSNCTGVLFDEAVRNAHLEDVLYPIDAKNCCFRIPMCYLANVANPIVADYIDFLKGLNE